MNKSHVHVLHLSTMQGRAEQRRETYKWYVERVAEDLTQQCTKSSGRVSDSVRKQAVAVQRMHGD